MDWALVRDSQKENVQLTITKTDVYVNGVWVNGKRLIAIRGSNQTLRMDCSETFPTRDRLDETFESGFEPIWSAVGSRLISQFLDKLANHEGVIVGGIRVVRDGVWLDGSWKFLWWKAKAKLIPWNDLKISNYDGTLALQSISDVKFRSELQFNSIENAIVLDAGIRFLMRDNNWRKLKAHELAPNFGGGRGQAAAV